MLHEMSSADFKMNINNGREFTQALFSTEHQFHLKKFPICIWAGNNYYFAFVFRQNVGNVGRPTLYK